MDMAKSDKTGHIELSVEQRNAIDLLVVGKTDQEVAEAVGKSRQTVCAWRLYHPDFRAELNKRRREVWGAAADKLRSLLPRALEVIEQELTEGESRVKVALDIVKLARIQMNSIGPHDPDAIVAEEVRSRDTTLLLCLGGQTNFAQVHQDLLEKAEG
jgi:hypothetical protein